MSEAHLQHLPRGMHHRRHLPLHALPQRTQIRWFRCYSTCSPHAAAPRAPFQPVCVPDCLACGNPRPVVVRHLDLCCSCSSGIALATRHCIACAVDSCVLCVGRGAGLGGVRWLQLHIIFQGIDVNVRTSGTRACNDVVGNVLIITVQLHKRALP